MEVSLNIDYHIKILLLVALAKYKTGQEQADALGITRRTLINYKKSIDYDERKNIARSLRFNIISHL